MKVEQFVTLTLSQLEELTGIDEANWSKWFNGLHVHEKTLQKVGQKLDMYSYDVLRGIYIKRALKGVELSHKLCQTK